MTHHNLVLAYSISSRVVHRLKSLELPWTTLKITLNKSVINNDQGTNKNSLNSYYIRLINVLIEEEANGRRGEANWYSRHKNHFHKH